MKKIFFVASCQLGESPTGGGTQVRNQLMYSYLKEHFDDLKFFDTYKKSPIYCILRILIIIIFNPKRTIILSLSDRAPYFLSVFLYFTRLKRNIIYWACGGDLHKRMANKKWKKCMIVYKKIIVQATFMKRELNIMGINNVMVVPNFKKINYMPTKPIFSNNDDLKFVFVSRIKKVKGVDLIINAMNTLQNNNCSVDFYGALSKEYTCDSFKQLASQKIRYKGFLDLSKKENIDKLSAYDVMLFPTYFEGEGFPGVLVDAFIAGLPVIASNHNANSEILDNKQNGLLIESKSSIALREAMLFMIRNRDMVKKMSISAQGKAKCYEINTVFGKALKELNLL